MNSNICLGILGAEMTHEHVVVKFTVPVEFDSGQCLTLRQEMDHEH